MSRSPSTPVVQPRGAGTGLALLVGVFVALTVATAAMLLRDGYRDTVENAAQDVRNLVALLRSDVAGKLLAVDGALIETASDAAEMADPAAAARLADRMAERAAFLGLIDAMAFVAPETLRAEIATPRWGTADVSGRGFVTRFLRDPTHRFHIGRPMNEIGLAGQMLHVARRVDGPDGGCAGVVVARLTPGALVSGITLQSVDERLTIGIRRDDGALVGRFPPYRTAPSDWLEERPAPPTCGETSAVVSLRQDELADGRERAEACARVTGFPLIVTASLDYEPAARRWRDNATVLIVLVAGAISVVLVLARAIRRRYDAAARTAMETRELATSMMASTPVAVLISELGSRLLVDANDQARRLLALGDGPLDAFDIEELVADRDVARAIGRRVWRGESLTNEEVELRDRNGSKHWAMASIRRFEHPDGPRALIVLADVTQLKRAT